MRHKKRPRQDLDRVFLHWRRERDSNPRSVISRTHDFQSCALDQLSHLSVPTGLLYSIFSSLSSIFSIFIKNISFSCLFLWGFVPFLGNWSRLVDGFSWIPFEKFQKGLYKFQNLCYNIEYTVFCVGGVAAYAKVKGQAIHGNQTAKKAGTPSPEKR